MKRLIEGRGKNSPQEYDKIFQERQGKEPDWFDMRRWKILLKYYKGGSILDIGCLDSRIPELIGSRYGSIEYTGLDVSKESINSMKSIYPLSTFYDRDLYDNVFSDESFDYIVLGEVLEHIEHPDNFLRESFRLLSSGGTLAISTPLEEERDPGAVDLDRHIWSYTKEDIEILCSPYGRVIIKTLGSRYFPTYKYQFPHIIAWVIKK